jgi:uncharacterized protein (TIGR03066 family)
MRKMIKFAALALCILLAFALASCGKQPYAPSTENIEKADDPSIIGFWLDSVKTSKNFDDVWEFRVDGSLSLHQIDEDGNVSKSIEGSYKIEGAKLLITLGGHTLTYDSYEIITDSLVLRDHGTETAFAKYTKTVYK